MDRPTDHPACDQPSDDAACYDENGVLIVDVEKLAKEPAPNSREARPSNDSPGTPGGTAGTGTDHTSQDN